MASQDRFSRSSNASSSGRWSTETVIKRDRTQWADDKKPAEPVIRVDVGRSTETSTELSVSCACGRHAVVVCEHPPAEARS